MSTRKNQTNTRQYLCPAGFRPAGVPILKLSRSESGRNPARKTDFRPGGTMARHRVCFADRRAFLPPPARGPAKAGPGKLDSALPRPRKAGFRSCIAYVGGPRVYPGVPGYTPWSPGKSGRPRVYPSVPGYTPSVPGYTLGHRRVPRGPRVHCVRSRLIDGRPPSTGNPPPNLINFMGFGGGWST